LRRTPYQHRRKVNRRARLGLTQRVVTEIISGERRDVLDQRWTCLLESYGYLAVPLPNRLVDPALALDALALDGLILTGGNDLAAVAGATDPAPERDALELRLLELAGDRCLPVLGVCRGMQIMARHYGAAVVGVSGHVVREHRIKAQPSSTIPLDAVEAVNSYHNFGVMRTGLGPDLVACALAEDGTVEAMAHRRLPHWAVMWHIERGAPTGRDRDILDALFDART
jgi:N5-(cytidine 5'-diphosphoramidyl)-L-glutamine hydrolase